MLHKLPFFIIIGFNIGLWSLLIPLWQFPDEQAHFAQVQNYVELGHSPKRNSNDLSFEIYESERLLGTLRTQFGINQYTYHAEYRPQYTTTKIGEYENYINNLPTNSRTQYVKVEEPRYPPLFYYLVGVGYRLAYSNGLIARVFATRLISVLIGTITAYAAYLLARATFPKIEALHYATALAVGFQPMLTFVSAGINNDTLLNCLSTILLYGLVRTITKPLTIRRVFFLGLVFALGVLTKQLMFLFALVVAIAVVYGIWKSRPSKTVLLKIGGALLLGLTIMLFLRRNEGFWLPYWPSMIRDGEANQTPMLQLIKDKALQLYRETFVWYWGVYKWLGVVLPIPILRTLKVIIGASLIGWVIALSRRKVPKRIGILVLANVTYIGILLAWDLSQIRTMGFSHGIQGRYFFPLIATHMLFLVAGLYFLTPLILRRWFLAGISILIVGLNLFSLTRVLGTYYDWNPTTLTILQLSQYKPVFAKWPYIGVYLGTYALSLIYLFTKLLPRQPKS